jgi:LysR family cyn operon transcriptional activator
VGLGFLTRHSPNLRYDPLWPDEISLIVPTSHPWAKRSFVNLREMHQQRLLQLPDTFVIRRMTDDICRMHLVRPKTVAEISSIEALLRSLAAVNAAALLPKIALHGSTGLKAVRLRGKNLSVEIGLLRLSDSDKNSAVVAFSKIAKAAVLKMIGR